VKGPYTLKLEKLRFLSAVDSPAQGAGAKALLLKRDGAMRLTAKVAKTDDSLGLVFGYAFSSSLDGGATPHVDYQDDTIDPDFLKCAMEFVAGGGATDVNHDGAQDGRVVFAWPLLPEINKALGIEAKTIGLAVAIKPSAETYQAFKRGELTGFSIEGTGYREQLDKRAVIAPVVQKFTSKFTDDGSRYQENDAQIVCVDIGKRAPVAYSDHTRSSICKATWTTAHIDDLPDSSFLYVEGGGTKDSDGKTAPRSLRHFPYRDENGKVDIDHLRDAIGRIPQSSLPATLRNKLQVKAEKLLAKQHDAASKAAQPTGKCTAGHDMAVDKSACPSCGAKMSYKSIRKQVVLTSEVDGHQHAIDLDDPADYCGDRLSTTYATSEGAELSHAHVWTFDPDSGEVTIATDSGHDHTVTEAVPPNVLAVFAMNERAEDQADAAALMQSILDGSAAPSGMSVSIAARNSPPKPHLQHGEPMDELKKQLADLLKRTERAERIAKMSGAHKTHFDTLTGDDAEAFIAKSTAERESIVAADVAKRGEADKIVYTSKATGDVYRAKDDPRLVDMAKRIDAQAEEVEKSTIATIAKSHLGTLAGDDEIHQYVVACCRKGGADAAKLEKVFTAMKGWNALGIEAAKAKGFNPGADAALPADKQGAYAALSKGLGEFCKKSNIAKVWTEGLSAFIETPEGAALKTAYDNAAATQAA
jgi:nitrite reductase/ring-hydroxylating ferredoxin subunit